MDKCRITVFFENPFWVGVMEQLIDGKLEAAKVTFGAESKDYEIYSYFYWKIKRLNKRKSIQNGCSSLSTANYCKAESAQAQQALKLQQEQGKTGTEIF
ncbi:DUF2992 family protein [Caproiciproducens galactitolivorans]|uniref:DUF2992 domain-containing protein n=1 Tax=Caproiciproducens galactitolivorans TaxID=642589 RepID=A0A4Z0YF80_9FIRM|nr:DUF2992 family protein [Caproiciproducens galactitolivorans]TGJ77975.1 hypothetical protein CAGA_03850 [Caproiciproducens galactitolivorans]